MTNPNTSPHPANAQYTPGVPLPPEVVQVITTPAPQMDPDVRAAGLERAKQLADFATLRDSFGVPYTTEFQGVQHPTFRHGTRYRDVFPFDGTILGKYDDVPADPKDWDPGLEIAGMMGNSGIGGKFTDAVFVMESGEMLLISRTRDTQDELSRNKQKFALISTSKAQGKEGSAENPRYISPDMLRGIVAAPGYPLLLGPDPRKGGKPPKTSENVKEIYAVRFGDDEEGRIPSNHKWAQPENAIDIKGMFREQLRRSRTTHPTGALAVRHTAK